MSELPRAKQVSERVRQDRFALDDALLRPYLEFDNVLHRGVFAAAAALRTACVSSSAEQTAAAAKALNVHVNTVHNRLETIAERLGDWQERMGQRRRLMMMDERMLHDLGLCRDDAIAEAAKPFWKP